MASMARRLLSSPLELFDGNAFYPYGETLAFSEPLLVPTLLGLPGFVWGNPVLTYNLLLLALWPLDGVAMAWVAHRLTRSWPAAWLAGAVFCLSPYFTEYYLEFQMLLAAPVPLVLFAWIRWLETGRRGWLGAALIGLTLEAATTWYYGIILGLALAAVTLGFLCLRWRGVPWARLAGQLALGAPPVALALLPVAWPYVVVHRELGFERGIVETAAHSADLFSFVEPGHRSWAYRMSPGGHLAETSVFAGFTALALAGGALFGRPGGGRPVRGRRARRLQNVLRLGLALASAAAVLLLLWPLPRSRVGRLVVHPRPAEFLDIAVLLTFGLLAVRGWAGSRGAGVRRRLGRGDWIRLAGLLAAVFVVLSLGPVLHVHARPVAPGPYLSLYYVLLPLHVVRVTARFAVIVFAAVALLAAFGLRAVEARLRRRPRALRLVRLAVFLALGAEYAVTPAPLQPAAWSARPVDAVLRAAPGDAAVLEWPTNVAEIDADAMVRSLVHGKYLVNGLSGFVPESLRELSGLLTTPGSPFPTAEADAVLRQLYPLRYLVVRLGDPTVTAEWRPAWLGLRTAGVPLLRFRGTYGSDDLYEVVPLPEAGVRLERRVSPEFLRRHPVLRIALRPRVTGPDLEQWAEVALNGRPVERLAVDGAGEATIPLPPPYRRAAPNAITLAYGYRRPPAARDARYRVGATGAVSPGDLMVESRGQPDGSRADIRLNDVPLAPDRRGYNLVALDADGRVLAAAAFDTNADPDASRRLAGWIAARPPGTLVAGAVRDEASDRLGADAVRALGTLGVAGDLRGRYRQAHAFVGVVGAAPGTALEALGPRPVTLRVGRPSAGLGFEVTGFELVAASPP